MLEIDPLHEYANGSNELNTIDEAAIIEQNIKIIHRIANQFRHQANTYCSLEDMYQIGCMAVLECSRKHQHTDDISFKSYISCRIRGAILDELRRLDWRSRQTRQQAHELNDIERSLQKSLGRPPKSSEVCHALGISEDEYVKRAQDSYAFEMMSLDQLVESGKYFQDPSCQTDDGLDENSLQEILNKNLDLLSKREQLILTLFYEYELNQNEIALTLNLTAPRVCQIHKEALQKLNGLNGSKENHNAKV